jgi:hypothetical protein
MKPRVLPIDTEIFELAEELFHTSALLRAYPFLSTQAEQSEPFHADWFSVLQAEIALLRARREAEARVINIDNHFDFLCTAISNTMLAENGNNRQAPVYKRYFGAVPSSKLKRPVLGEQLDVMRTWVPSLTGPESSLALQAYGKQLAARVAEADEAVRAQAEAERQEADFEVGARKAFVDRLNAHRQVLYGQLAELPHSHPEWNLSSDFAHRFFLRETGSRRLTIPELEEKLLRLNAKVRKYEAQLVELIEDQEAQAQLRDEADEAEAAEELAALERQRAEAAERLAAIKARRTSRSP